MPDQRSPARPPAEPTTAVVVGRYAGTVDVLAQVLRASGVAVRAAAGIDVDGPAAIGSVLRAHPDAVVVLTLAPDDPTRELVAGRDRVVAVTWHPADERPDLPGARVVESGRIHADLAREVSSW